MKYVVIIDSGDELSEEEIENLKGTLLIDNNNGDKMYCFDIVRIKQAPKPMDNEMVGIDGFYGGYNQGLRDCGVLEE